MCVGSTVSKADPQWLVPKICRNRKKSMRADTPIDRYSLKLSSLELGRNLHQRLSDTTSLPFLAVGALIIA